VDQKAITEPDTHQRTREHKEGTFSASIQVRHCLIDAMAWQLRQAVSLVHCTAAGGRMVTAPSLPCCSGAGKETALSQTPTVAPESTYLRPIALPADEGVPQFFGCSTVHWHVKHPFMVCLSRNITAPAGQKAGRKLAGQLQCSHYDGYGTRTPLIDFHGGTFSYSSVLIDNAITTKNSSLSQTPTVAPESTYLRRIRWQAYNTITA
jgi:hypothetical protein